MNRDSQQSVVEWMRVKAHRKDFSAAIREGRDHIRRYHRHNHHEVRNELAHVFLLVGAFSAALSHVNIVLTACPDNSPAIIIKAKALANMHQTRSAEAELRKGIEFHKGTSDCAKVIISLAQLLWDLGKTEKSRELLATKQKEFSESGHWEAKQGRAFILNRMAIHACHQYSSTIETKYLEMALAFTEKALSLDPLNTFSIETKARILIHIKDKGIGVAKIYLQSLGPEVCGKLEVKTIMNESSTEIPGLPKIKPFLVSQR